MSKDLHVYTYGFDPFVFSVGDVTVYVHGGAPIQEIVLSKIDAPMAALTMPKDPDQLRRSIDERTKRDQQLRLVVDRKGPTLEPAKLDAILTGLHGAHADNVSLHLVENAKDLVD
ncbi:MAG TPA: hypothetical protein VKP64_05095 [Mycobacteriales bacterium]|nr:hypothetical protein [Mycobacteriales bacterium]